MDFGVLGLQRSNGFGDDFWASGRSPLSPASHQYLSQGEADAA
jgi:hypothetical protein